MIRVRGAVPALLAAALAWSGLRAQEAAPPTPEELAAREKIRPAIEAIWKDVRTPEPGTERDPLVYYWQVVDKLVALGPPVVPFLESEVDLADPVTFPFAAYVLGQFPGPESEAALRKAVRVADARGGRFGGACKRYALFSLALMGKPDVLDAAQNGEEVQWTAMAPDFILMVHMAALVGHAGAPILSKQLDAYLADTESTEKLQYTILALGRSGDESFVPKLLPLLKSPSAGVRAQAADTLSRLGPADICLQLMPLLDKPKQRENYSVAEAFVRAEPEPCYKAIVARLEVEENIEVRAALYAVVATLGGEKSLDVFRSYLGDKNFIDRTVIAEMIGRVRSPKGLNMLRLLLADTSSNVAERAVEALGVIGGEGATDSLLAMTADRRRSIALTASRVLTDAGVRRAGPRIASLLLEMVREPVGELELRAPIAQLSEALVTLEYPEPVEDLKKAADLQTDPEIKDALTSCVARLELIAKNRDEVPAWIATLDAPTESVRILAGRRLAEIGSGPAVAALESRLARADLAPEERAAIFRAFADAKTTGAASLIEKNLADPAADAADVRDARAAAAWAARRIGGERMIKALRASAVRRDGRDWATIAYLAVLDPKNAAETLKPLAVRRLRYPTVTLEKEDRHMDAILYDLAAGRMPFLYDVPPEALRLL